MKYLIFLIAISSFQFTACKKLILVETPKNQLTSDKVFLDSTSAISALANIYGQFERNVEPNITNTVGLYSDELLMTSTDATTKEFLISKINPSNSNNEVIWQNLYFTIYSCNDLIERLGNKTNFSVSKSETMINEARFLRAFCFFQLTSLFGKIPLVISTNANINRSIKQSTEDVIYEQIINDLKIVKKNLPEQYQGSGKVRVNKWAASALLARIYLIQKDWIDAEAESTLLINCGQYQPLDALDKVFKAGSTESILQFWTKDGFTTSSTFMIPSTSNSIPSYPITPQLLNSFEEGDLRKSTWLGINNVIQDGTTVTFYYPYKYKNRVIGESTPEYLTLLRLTEQFLIRSEARVHLSKLGDAKSDLNIIRKRAGLENSKASTDEELLFAIAKERQTELFCEWGLRFIDLKRTGSLDIQLGYKSSWRNAASVFPIPQKEITYNHNLIQNPTY